LITAPITWGNYSSEKGLLTGVNSGLLVNSKPRIPEYNRSKITLTKEGHMFLGATGGFNTRPGIQYVPYGRRMFGPYSLRGFGNIPDPDSDNNNVGEGFFWCRVPANKTMSSTIVWNPADLPLTIKIKVNGKEISSEIKAGETATINCPLDAATVKMTFTGDRRLVLLQTSFK
jgi:beta-galactosidase